MEIQFLGTGAGQPSKQRNVSSLALKLLDELNEVWLFDCGESTQHQILKTNIRPRKINRIFISHNHGDHIFGLPGFLSSRSFQGDGGPLTIYGPSGLEQYVRTSLRVSKTKISYPIKFVVVERAGLIYSNSLFNVYCERLEHRIDSFGYRIEEKSRPGELLIDRLAQYNIPNGPILGQLKAKQTVQLSDGTVLNGADFVGPDRPGRVVTVIYDTRQTAAIDKLAKNADVLIHEATFAADEDKMAREYYHSTSKQAAEVAKRNHVGKLLLTHVSARYLGQKARQLEQQARDVFENSFLANDLDSFEIPMKEWTNE